MADKTIDPNDAAAVRAAMADIEARERADREETDASARAAKVEQFAALVALVDSEAWATVRDGLVAVWPTMLEHDSLAGAIRATWQVMDSLRNNLIPADARPAA